MKKAVVICLQTDRAKTVAHLQELGIVHVQTATAPDSGDFAAVLQKQQQAERALSILESREVEPKLHPEADLDDLISKTLKASDNLHHLRERLAHWQRSRLQLEPWGSFNFSDITNIRRRGLKVFLSTASEGQLPDLPEDTIYYEISRSNKTVYFVVIAPEPVPLDLSPASLPEVTDLAEIDAKIRECEEELEKNQAELDRLAVERNLLRQELSALAEKVDYVRARDTMEAEKQVCYLSGYLPDAEVPALENEAAKRGWAVLISEPDPQKEKVPTKVSLPQWVEPIRIVFKGLGIIPGYHEIDISAWFLIFFSIFFAILIGDAGYGAIILVATIAARKKFKKAPPQPFWLFEILAISTIIWGVLSGNYFGIDLSKLPGFLSAVPTIDYLNNAQNVQRICFLLGAIHLTIAHLWNAIVIGRRWRALSEIGWACIIWGNYFLALKLVVGQVPPEIFGVTVFAPFYTIGFIAVILFSLPQPNPLKMIGAGTGALALGIINSFVDVVSYVRLFAVGAATLKVAQSFNEMAFAADMPGWLLPIFAALILLLGHGLNMVLGAMGVLVHGIRLNVLEFSGHLGMEWSGIEYDPLRRKRKDEALEG